MLNHFILNRLNINSLDKIKLTQTLILHEIKFKTGPAFVSQLGTYEYKHTPYIVKKERAEICASHIPLCLMKRAETLIYVPSQKY